MAKLAPSILSADFSRLGDDIMEAENSGADLIHIDVMDGHFVPNITIGPLIVDAISKMILPIDVHLMIENPSDYVELFCKSLEKENRDISLDYISFHIEASYHPHRLLNQIRELKVKSGIALNPFNTCKYNNSSFRLNGSTYFNDCKSWIWWAKFHRNNAAEDQGSQETSKGQRYRDCGSGVTEKNIKKIRDAGADILVAGSAVFNKKDSIKNNIIRLKALV